MKLFWKIHYKGSDWCSSKFEIHEIVPDMTSDDILYVGITIFGRSLIYSDTW